MPQLPVVRLPRDITVYFWHITESLETLQQRYTQCISEQRNWEQENPNSTNPPKVEVHSLEIEDPNHLTTSPKHKHFLASRLLLHAVFGPHPTWRDEHGKPHLSQLYRADLHTPNTHINYSHAENWVVLACHPNNPIGVDIEGPRAQLHRIYKRICSEDEIAWIGQNPSIELLQKAWCAKEALYKALGKKGTDFRLHLQLLPNAINDQSMNARIIIPLHSHFFPNTQDKASPITLNTEVHFYPMENMMTAVALLPEL